VFEQICQDIKISQIYQAAVPWLSDVDT